MWLLKSLNEKETFPSADLKKFPYQANQIAKAAENYGPFACIAEDVMSLAGGLSELKSYSYDGSKCTRSDRVKSDL